MILYLHGFASTGEGGKWELLRDAFPEHDVQSPTLPVDPIEALDVVGDLLAKHRDDRHLVIGTSLGGFFAYVAAARFPGVSAVVINPAMTPWDGMEQHIGTVTRFDTDETFAWTAEHVANLKRLFDDAGRAPGDRVHFVLARDDELLDHSGIPDAFPEVTSVQWFDEAEHRFTRFAELLPWLRTQV